MGKASKWILNFLIGKQEKKNEAKQCLPSTTKPTQPGTQKVKRRWSFGRSSHRVSKSVDTMDTTTILPLMPQQILSFFVAREVENAAATRIQAAFRGHLARKALHALKGLVKLQALIRGHFVRKRTNDTMKRMHALLSIQVRARLQRIEKAEVAAQVVNKKQSPIQRSFNQANEVHRKKIYMKYNESQRVMKSTCGYRNHSKPERVDQGYTNICPDRLSYSNRHPYNESLFTTPEVSPRMPSPRPKPTRSSTPFQHHDSLVEAPPIYDYYSFMPSYMANTQSSRAKKVRSQSAPKQRPDGSSKHKYKNPELVHSTDEQFLRHSPSKSRSNDHIDHDPWFVKLYRPGRLFEDDNLDYINPCARHSISNYAESLVAEPHVVLY